MGEGAKVEEKPKETLWYGLSKIGTAFQDSDVGRVDLTDMALGIRLVIQNLPDSAFETAPVEELDDFLDGFTQVAGGHMTGREMNSVTSRICDFIKKKEASA